MRFELCKPEDARPVLCNARRGGKRSRITCERPALHCANQEHIGRNGYGWWYSWGPVHGAR